MVPDEAVTRAKYPAGQVIEVIVVYVVPVIAHAVITDYPTIVEVPSPYFKAVAVEHYPQVVADAT